MQSAGGTAASFLAGLSLRVSSGLGIVALPLARLSTMGMRGGGNQIHAVARRT